MPNPRILTALLIGVGLLAAPAPAGAHYLDARTAVREVRKVARELAQEFQVDSGGEDSCRRRSAHEIRCNAFAIGEDPAVERCMVYTQKVTVRFRGPRTYRLRVIAAGNVGARRC